MYKNYSIVRYTRDNTLWGRQRPWGPKIARMEAPATRNQDKILFRADADYELLVDSIALLFSGVVKKRVTKAKVLRTLVLTGKKIVEAFGDEMEPELRSELLCCGVDPGYLLWASITDDPLRLRSERTMH